MAKHRKKKLKLNSSTILKLVIVLSVIVLLIVGGIVFFKQVNKHNTNKEIVTKSVKTPYSIRFNATPLQTDLFEELEKAYEAKTDEKLIVELVAKNFVADFYTLNNKLLKNDIGGSQFLDKQYRLNFRSKAINTYYYHLEDYIHDYGKNNLPEVSEFVSVSSRKQEKDYVVSLTWKYKDVEKFPINTIVHKALIGVEKNSNNEYYVNYIGE